MFGPSAIDLRLSDGIAVRNNPCEALRDFPKNCQTDRFYPFIALRIAAPMLSTARLLGKMGRETFLKLELIAVTPL